MHISFCSAFFFCKDTHTQKEEERESHGMFVRTQMSFAQRNTGSLLLSYTNCTNCNWTMYVSALIYLIFPLQQLFLAFFLSTCLSQIHMTEFTLNLLPAHNQNGMQSAKSEIEREKDVFSFVFHCPLNSLDRTKQYEKAHLTQLCCDFNLYFKLREIMMISFVSHRLKISCADGKTLVLADTVRYIL